MISKAGPVLTSAVPIFGPHVLETLSHPELLSLTSPKLGGAGRGWQSWAAADTCLSSLLVPVGDAAASRCSL